MQIDTGKIDGAVLALLYLTLHDGVRGLKVFRLGHDEPATRERFYFRSGRNTKSVLLSERGLKESERLFNKYFAKA